MPDRRYLTGLLLALVVCVSTGVTAQQKDGQDLDAVRAEQSAEEEKARRLEGESAALRAQLKEQSAALAQLASRIRDRETELTRLEAAQAASEQRIAALQQALAADRQRIAETLSALAGVSQTPPLAVVARPGEANKARLAASALAGLRPALESRVRALNETMRTLRDEQAALAEMRTRAARALEEIERDRADLKEKIAAKQALARTSEAEAADARKRVQALAEQVRTLTALMRKLDELQPVAAPAGQPVQAGFPALRGRLPLPAEGDVAARFGERRGQHDPNGILVRTRPGAIVTAPHDAIVRFAGPFRSYEGLLILDFGDGYHLLVAGLSGIDVVVGQWLLAGEPVGRVSTGAGGGAAEIYLELRRGGSPIDPAPWLAKRQGRSSG